MLRQEKLCECRGTDMALVLYERRSGFEVGNDSGNNVFKPYACTVEYRSYDPHHRYNLQHRSVVQRRALRHLLEAWYFWLGIALLIVSVICSVFYPDVMHVTVIGETLRDSISQEPIKTRYL